MGLDDEGFEIGGNDNKVELNDNGYSNYMIVTRVSKNYGLANDDQVNEFFQDINIDNEALQNDYDTLKNGVAFNSYRGIAESIINGDIKLNGYQPASNDVNNKRLVSDTLNFIEGVIVSGALKEHSKNLFDAGKNFQSNDVFNFSDGDTKEDKGLLNLISETKEETSKALKEIDKEILLETQERLKNQPIIEEKEPEEPKKEEPKKTNNNILKEKEEEELNPDDYEIEEPGVVKKNILLDDNDDDGFEIDQGPEVKPIEGNIEEFNENFGIGFDERGEDYLTKLDAKVEKSGMDALNTDEKKFAYFKVLDSKYGKPADFDTIKNGIKIMDKAQQNYDRHNIFARALSHLGFFSDIAKERENINKMKEVFERQNIDSKAINDIRNSSIHELPKSTISAQKLAKKEREKYLDDHLKVTKSKAENKAKEFSVSANNELKSKFIGEKFEEYDIEGKVSRIQDEYREIRDDLEAVYGKGCLKLTKDKDFIQQLKDNGDFDNFMDLANKYKTLHNSVDERKNPNFKMTMLEDAMKKDGQNLQEDTNNYVKNNIDKYVKDKSDKYVQSCVKGALNEMYENGLFDNEQEIDNQMKYMFKAPKENKLDLKKLGDDTNMELESKKSIEHTNEKSKDLNKSLE